MEAAGPFFDDQPILSEPGRCHSRRQGEDQTGHKVFHSSIPHHVVQDGQDSRCHDTDTGPDSKPGHASAEIGREEAEYTTDNGVEDEGNRVHGLRLAEDLSEVSDEVGQLCRAQDAEPGADFVEDALIFQTETSR